MHLNHDHNAAIEKGIGVSFENKQAFFSDNSIFDLKRADQDLKRQKDVGRGRKIT